MEAAANCEQSESLVHLNRAPRRCPATWAERAASGPVVDKYFALGALFGLVGSAGYGAYLWLVLNGFLTMPSNYFDLRHAHVVVQVYLFFGLFVLGFLSQAGGKMLGAPLAMGKRPLLILPLYVAGGFALLAGYSAGGLIISGLFLGFAVYIAIVCWRSWSPVGRLGRPMAGRARPLQAMLTLLGLAVLALSTFLPLDSPPAALLLLWGGFGSMIFAAGGHFIAAFLGGRNLGGKSGKLFLLLHMISVLLLALDPAANLSLAAPAALAAVLCYLYSCAAWQWLRAAAGNPLGLAFVSGYFWAIAAWIMQIMRGSAGADFTAHMFALGWAAPLIFAISSQVVGFLTGRDSLLPRRLWFSLLLVWQLVPLGRAALHANLLPAWFPLVVAAASAVVMLTWTAALCRAEWQMLRLQSSLGKGEVIKSCG